MTVLDQIRARGDELAQVCQRHSVKALDLFGSGARADFEPERSDLDFLVEFEDLPVGAYANAYFGLLESLQQLFREPVDLVVASAIRNPYFRHAVEQTRTPLYAA